MTAGRSWAIPEGVRHAPAVLVVLVLLVGIGAGPAVSAKASVPDGDARPAVGVVAAQVDADDVLLAVDLRTDGAAEWRVEYRIRLDDENATEAFEELRADVESNQSAYADRFAERMRVTVAEAEAATGRDMMLENVSVRTSSEQLPQQYGVLTYTFTWTNFAVVEDDRLRAGDALAGLFLDQQTSLLLSWPSDHRLVTVSPTPSETRESSVLWRGPTDFGPGEPTLVVAAGGAPTAIDTSLLGVAVVGLVLAGVGLLWWRRRGMTDGERAAEGPSPTTRATDEEPTDVGGGEPPEELLSNEERVLALLEKQGGRMKQQDVVEALGWTDAKTSQVVSQLRDEGRLEGFRLGRENVLRLPEADESPVGATGDDDEEDDDAPGSRRP